MHGSGFPTFSIIQSIIKNIDDVESNQSLRAPLD